ncbi:hypothetical protein BH09PLA1_BH09PLA1_33150 [soil metagenome]
MFKLFSPLVLITLALGCTKYEYDITRPANLAMHIGFKEDASASWPPVEYRFRAVENRLVVNIYNKTDEPMQLLGDRSSVVDPAGQSHPLRSQPIAPQSFIKLILPPPRPTIQRSGPSFGIGVGTRIGDRRRVRDGFDNDFDDYDYAYEPRYLAVIDDDALYWTWSGEGEIRLMLVFTRKDETFSHEFVIRRVKM